MLVNDNLNKMRKERVKISSSFKEKKGKIIRNYYENPKKRDKEG